MTDNFWENFLIEIGMFTFLGVLYYFYQKRKLVYYEENKSALIAGFILQSCLTEKKDFPQPQLDTLIESLDDYLHKRTPHPPLALLKVYTQSNDCSEDLKNIIIEGISEIETIYGKK